MKQLFSTFGPRLSTLDLHFCLRLRLSTLEFHFWISKLDSYPNSTKTGPYIADVYIARSSPARIGFDKVYQFHF
jgi:hypothetical protein